MTERATRCPHCQTSFYVSHQQLQSANGLVRCGACLQVFNANQHWVEQRPSDDDSGQLEFTSFDETLDSDDDLLSDLKRDNASLLSSPREPLRSRTETQEAQTEALDQEATREPAEQDTTRIEPTFQLVETEQKAFSDDTPAGDDESVPPEPPTATSSVSTETDEEDAAPTFGTSPEQASSEETLVEEEASPPPQPEPVIAGGADTFVETIDLEAADRTVEATEHEQAEMDSAIATEEETESLRAIREELVSHGGRRPRRRNGLWFLLAVLASLGLAGQYVYYYFDELVQSPYRFWFERGCTLVEQYSQFPCELPPPSRPELIHAVELVVRSHPDREDALRVDALIRNDAPFNQPFPALQLQFTDLNGKVVAARRFQPGEYLGGEVNAGDDMPSRQDIRIVLEVVDPAPDAVNYQLLFYPPEE